MPQKHSSAENLYTLFYAIRRKLNEVSAKYWTDLEIFYWLNRGQLHIARKTKCLKRTATITTTASTQEYDLRSTTNGFEDIIDIAEDGVEFSMGGTNRQPLNKKHIWQLNRESPGWRDISASIPKDYYYDKATKTIGLHPKPNSTNAGAYLFIAGFHKPKVLLAGTAEAGSTTTIKLQVGSTTYPYPNPTDDYYNNIYIEIYQGTGAGQKAKITDYDGGTRTCTAAFTTAPDTTSIYGMVPEVPEEMHYLMKLFAFGRAFEKGGSRTNLANNYWKQYYSGLNLAIDEYNEDSDEDLEREAYR